MDLLRLTNKLSQTEIPLNESSGLRKSMRQTPQIIKTLLKIFLRRQRYSFQLFKYFVLFPGSSQLSEDISLDSYDRLIFSDDAIHSMVKIYEVKELQNKIWAFLNIKALKYLETCKLFSKKIQQIYIQKFQKPVKSNALRTIKQYDLFIQNQIKQGRLILGSKSKNFVDQEANTFHKEKLKPRSNIYEVKIQGKSNLNSKLAILSNQSISSKQKLLQSNTKLLDQANLTESQSFPDQLIQSINRSQSKISIKLQTKTKVQDESAMNRNDRSQSFTKIRFTYTSPTKQQVKQNLKNDQKTYRLTQNKRRKDDCYSAQYKYAVPKNIENKRVCCQNLCGLKCNQG